MSAKRFVLIAVFSFVSSAQPLSSHVSIDTSGRPVSLNGSNLISIISKLNATDWKQPSDGSWEQEVLNAAEQGSAKTLRLNLAALNPPRISTSSESTGDVLASRWDGAPDRPEKAIWLWDTPQDTTFIIETDTSLIEPKQLAKYCEDLFVWDNFIELKSIVLTFSNATSGPVIVRGHADHVHTSRGIYGLGFQALGLDAKGYIAVFMSKSLFSLFSYPAEADGVPERFPPLSTRLAGRSDDALLRELGKGFDPQGSVLFYPRNRDAIVLTELLARGPVSDSEISEIILGGFGDGKFQHLEIIFTRFDALLQALEKTHQVAIYLTKLERVLCDAVAPVAGTSVASRIAGRFFAVTERNNVDATPAALEFVANGKCMGISFLYLQQHIQDRATLNKLVELRVAPEFQDLKDQTVKNVQWRLSSQH